MSDEKEVKGVVVDTVVATPVNEEKQGSKCCNCCCDFRRAVVVTSIIVIVYSTIMTILAATGAGVMAAIANSMDDDTGIDGIEMEEGALGVGVVAGLFVVGILFGVFQLMGALKYNVCILTTCLVFEVLNLVWTCFTQWSAAENTAGAIIAVIVSSIIYIAIWIYPLVGLIKEINAGIMTEETYPREAYSCCCEPKV